jgi:hypothetical protein
MHSTCPARPMKRSRGAHPWESCGEDPSAESDKTVVSICIDLNQFVCLEPTHLGLGLLHRVLTRRVAEPRSAGAEAVGAV